MLTHSYNSSYLAADSSEPILWYGVGCVFGLHLTLCKVSDYYFWLVEMCLYLFFCFFIDDGLGLGSAPRELDGECLRPPSGRLWNHRAGPHVELLCHNTLQHHQLHYHTGHWLIRERGYQTTAHGTRRDAASTDHGKRGVEGDVSAHAPPTLSLPPPVTPYPPSDEQQRSAAREKWHLTRRRVKEAGGETKND